MDEQRLERALRRGPPFATHYVSRPLALNEPRGGRRGAGTGRVVLLVAATALLLAGMLGGLAALAGLRDDSPGPRQEDAIVIEGLDGQAFMDAWEDTGFNTLCSPTPATAAATVVQWRCGITGPGTLYDRNEGIILLGESPSAIHSIEAWVALADGGPVDPLKARELFAFVAETAEFTGADTAAARAWVLENGGTQSGQLEISGVTYTLSGTTERRVFTMAPGALASPATPVSAAPVASPACFLTTECPPSSVVRIDTANWVPFTSDRYGYTIAHPPSWTATPATRAWAFTIDQRLPGCCDFEGSDRFADPSPATTQNSSSTPQAQGVYPIHLTAFAIDVLPGGSEDRFRADYYASRPDIAPGFCLYADAERRPVSVDGHPGTMIVGDTDCGDAAFVFIDGRVHVFELEAYDRPALIPEWRTLKTALLEAFLGTVEFRGY